MKHKKMFKPIKVIVLLHLMAVTLIFTKPTSASSLQTIQADVVSIRSNPSWSGAVLTKLYQGAKVESLKKNLTWQSDQWTRIALPETARVWVSSNYLKHGYVTASNLHVRSGPGSWADSLGLIPGGTKVQALEQYGNWIRIKVPQGLSAYVVSRFLDGNSNATTSSVATTPTNPKPIKIPTLTVKHESPVTPKGDLIKELQLEIAAENAQKAEAESTEPNSASDLIDTLSPATTGSAKKKNWFKRLFKIE